jgi:transposase InsO family protein
MVLVRRVLEDGWRVADAAAAFEISERTAFKWLARFRSEGIEGLWDRSSRPHRSPARTRADRVEAILKLRRLWFTAAEIAETLSMPLSTVSVVLKRNGLGRRSALVPKEQQRRYERARPGELVHVDIKKLARIDGVGHRIHGDRGRRTRRGGRSLAATIGYEYVDVCVDDATRLAYAEVLADERATTAVGFLRRAVAFFRSMGIRVERVMTDNGSAYISRLHRGYIQLLGARHLRTRPWRPQTNGKAERFIQTMLNGWAYAAIYGTSSERTAALAGWLELYNRRRPHGSLSRQTPTQRLNNLRGSYS